MLSTSYRMRTQQAWRTVLGQVETAIADSLYDVERQEKLLANEPASDTARMERVQSRLDERIKSLAARVNEAEQSAAEAAQELAAAEADLRQWVDQIGGIAKRIDILAH